MMELRYNNSPDNLLCTMFCYPLALDWAATVNKFQGFKAGFNKEDAINTIIANINNVSWERLDQETAYMWP